MPTLLKTFLISCYIKVWGSDESSLELYTELDDNGSLEMCRGSTLKDNYLQKLVQCMESLFFQRHSVVPSLVADVNQHVYRSAGCVSISPETVVQATRSATMDGRLYRCLLCSGISIVPEVSPCSVIMLQSCDLFSTCRVG